MPLCGETFEVMRGDGSRSVSTDRPGARSMLSADPANVREDDEMPLQIDRIEGLMQPSMSSRSGS